MEKNKFNPILYLHEYRHIPDEILRWKNDENLKPWKPDLFTASDFPEYKFREPETDRSQSEELSGGIPERLCVGIGTYKTTKDGEIYLCILIDPEERTVKSYSIGVYRSEELVEKALGNLFAVYGEPDKPLILRSSQNSLYQRKQYRELLEAYPVRAEMTEKGTRGGVMEVSTFYSQLMRRKGSYEFRDWQAAVDWLSNYIYRYNAKKGFSVNSKMIDSRFELWLLYSGGSFRGYGAGSWHADDSEDLCLCMGSCDWISCNERKPVEKNE